MGDSIVSDLPTNGRRTGWVRLVRFLAAAGSLLGFLAALGLIAGAVPMYWSEYPDDHAVANLKAQIMVVFGAAILWCSIAILPYLRWFTRFKILAAPWVAAAIFTSAAAFAEPRIVIEEKISKENSSCCVMMLLLK